MTQNVSKTMCESYSMDISGCMHGNSYRCMHVWEFRTLSALTLKDCQTMTAKSSRQPVRDRESFFKSLYSVHLHEELPKLPAQAALAATRFPSTLPAELPSGDSTC
jgi:hypothetical protein